MRRRLVLLAAIGTAVFLLPTALWAVVHQVHGLVVPVQGQTCPGAMDGCLQTGLNYGEGINPPSNPPVFPGPVRAQLDANTGPETFLVPKTGGKFNSVKVKLLQEGASFENIFGWYNVDEPSKRYPVIFSCPGAKTDPYEPPVEGAGGLLSGGFSTVIDFEAEYQAGRYKGKQLGFYLITPEGTSSLACATDPYDQGTLTSGGPINDDGIVETALEDERGFGRLYYTESKLNNDGNYVHYLIYQSKQEPKRFFFGFEDLFRGGDNDYDDTLVSVDGLVPTCQPDQEVCNGLDDNCNDKIDENVFRSCGNACGPGVEQCSFSNDGNPDNDWINCTAPKAQPEICDAKDNDCDGQIDEDVPSTACTLGNCPGMTKCLKGIVVCDAPAPSSEICDGKDNDCDKSVDEDLIRPCTSACGFGVETCQFTDDGNPNNDWAGCNAPQPTRDICDGIDNDCDGFVDEDDPGEGAPCDGPPGSCQQGKMKCVAGVMTCVGATGGMPEICDCKDNDCDGQIDEEAPCPAGSHCVECGCRVPCSGAEFGCPESFSCRNGYCVPNQCGDVICKADEKCVANRCVSVCEGVSCPTGKVCVSGFCVENNCYGLGCPFGQVCLKAKCQPDPCADVHCGTGEFCERGQCQPSCGPVACGELGLCEYGVCRDNPCGNITCVTGVSCLDGKCDAACADVHCGESQVCRRGQCIDNPCTGVRCYGYQETCQNGQCISPRTYTGSRTDLLASGSGGVSCAIPSTPASAGSACWLLLGLAAWLASGRRRWTLWAAVGVLLVLGALGCNQDPMAFINIGDAGAFDVPPGDVKPCVPTNGGVEICDYQDNDCDGQADEGFHLLTDAQNCGKCGQSCLKKGALTICELGACKFLGCAPGFINLNGDPDDGCELECTPTGVEVCDGKDNDCNGKIDEDIDVQSDVLNCGACGKPCQLAHAVPKCEKGICKIQQCVAGFINKDKTDSNGCEVPCSITNGGAEICDGLDNDCNGVVDDPVGTLVDLQNDPLNCGACGVVCALPNTTMECQKGNCVILGCKGGYVDADKNKTNGCECLPSGPEVCDSLDNDCDGKIDEDLSGSKCGTDVGECVSGTLICTGGLSVCQGSVGPAVELCDGKDSDCDGTPDPKECVFPGKGHERRLDQLNTTDLGASNSVQLTVSGNGDRVLAAWLDRRNDKGDVYANLSTDGGKTWRVSDVAVDTAGDSKSEPQAAFGGPSGTSVRAYVAYERFGSGSRRTVQVRRSLDGGVTWQDPVSAETNIPSEVDSLFTRIAVRPGTSSTQDTVVVCWERIRCAGPIRPNVYCSVSFDSGATFSPESRVNSVQDNAFVPALAVDSNYAYVAWQQGSQIRAARAGLGGASLAFTDDVLLAAGAGLEPKIAAGGNGTVLVVWEDVRDPLINIRANRSADSGKTWMSDGVRVDKDVVDGDSTNPWVAMRPGGRAFVAWEDTSRGKQDIYTNFSDDGGKTWNAAAIRVDTDIAGTAASLRPMIALHPTSSAVYVAWEDLRNGPKRDIYFSISLNNGASWNVPDWRVNESSPAGAVETRTPFVWPGSSRVAVIWVDYRTLGGGGHTTGPSADIYASYLE